jgi:predicted phosphodiesterase
MRFLCISDIHGNAAALKRVLDHARDREYHQLIVCGDLLFPGPAPLETWKLLLQHNAMCIQGASDAAISTLEPESLRPTTDAQRRRVERLEQMHDELGDLIIARLARLKNQARLPLENGQEMLVVHGSPRDPLESMCFDMDDDELYALLGGDPADIVVCGGSHVPFERRVGDVHIVNVGSVGDSPTPGIANATLIETSPLGISIDQFEVELE